jgi:hypothetical protein
VAAAAVGMRKNEENEDIPVSTTVTRVGAAAAGISGDESREVPLWADDSKEDF